MEYCQVLQCRNAAEFVRHAEAFFDSKTAVDDKRLLDRMFNELPSKSDCFMICISVLHELSSSFQEICFLAAVILKNSANGASSTQNIAVLLDEMPFLLNKFAGQPAESPLCELLLLIYFSQSTQPPQMALLEYLDKVFSTDSLTPAAQLQILTHLGQLNPSRTTAQIIEPQTPHLLVWLSRHLLRVPAPQPSQHRAPQETQHQGSEQRELQQHEQDRHAATSAVLSVGRSLLRLLRELVCGERVAGVGDLRTVVWSETALQDVVRTAVAVVVDESTEVGGLPLQEAFGFLEELVRFWSGEELGKQNIEFIYTSLMGKTQDESSIEVIQAKTIICSGIVLKLLKHQLVRFQDAPVQRVIQELLLPLCKSTSYELTFIGCRFLTKLVKILLQLSESPSQQNGDRFQQKSALMLEFGREIIYLACKRCKLTREQYQKYFLQEGNKNQIGDMRGDFCNLLALIGTMLGFETTVDVFFPVFHDLENIVSSNPQGNAVFLSEAESVQFVLFATLQVVKIPNSEKTQLIASQILELYLKISHDDCLINTNSLNFILLFLPALSQVDTCARRCFEYFMHLSSQNIRAPNFEDSFALFSKQACKILKLTLADFAQMMEMHQNWPDILHILVLLAAGCMLDDQDKQTILTTIAQTVMQPLDSISNLSVASPAHLQLLAKILSALPPSSPPECLTACFSRLIPTLTFPSPHPTYPTLKPQTHFQPTPSTASLTVLAAYTSYLLRCSSPPNTTPNSTSTLQTHHSPNPEAKNQTPHLLTTGLLLSLHSADCTAARTFAHVLTDHSVLLGPETTNQILQRVTDTLEEAVEACQDSERPVDQGMLLAFFEFFDLLFERKPQLGLEADLYKTLVLSGLKWVYHPYPRLKVAVCKVLGYLCDMDIQRLQTLQTFMQKMCKTLFASLWDVLAEEKIEARYLAPTLVTLAESYPKFCGSSVNQARLRQIAAQALQEDSDDEDY